MEASSPGESLSETPLGLGGILREKEPPVGPTTCLFQCLFQTDTYRLYMGDERFVFAAPLSRYS